MKAVTTIIIAFICGLTCITAQSTNKPVGKVTYIRNVDAMGERVFNGLTTLLFNTTQSLFIHNQAPSKDSTSFVRELETSGGVFGDPTGFPMYKDHIKNQILFKVPCKECKNGGCIVTDTFGTIRWELHPLEHKRFGQYTCEKATGAFRGRVYEVWYTLDIPVMSGPYKFGGLPGLILEARSTDNIVQFLFNSIEISGQIAGAVTFPEGGIDTHKTIAEYIKNEDVFLQNLEKELKAKGADITITRMETIELNMNN